MDKLYQEGRLADSASLLWGLKIKYIENEMILVQKRKLTKSKLLNA